MTRATATLIGGPADGRVVDYTGTAEYWYPLGKAWRSKRFAVYDWHGDLAGTGWIGAFKGFIMRDGSFRPAPGPSRDQNGWIKPLRLKRGRKPKGRGQEKGGYQLSFTLTEEAAREVIAIIRKKGLGQETHLKPGLLRCLLLGLAVVQEEQEQRYLERTRHLNHLAGQIQVIADFRELVALTIAASAPDKSG